MKSTNTETEFFPPGSLCSPFGRKVLVFSPGRVGVFVWVCLFVFNNFCSAIQANLTGSISCRFENESIKISQAPSPVIL